MKMRRLLVAACAVFALVLACTSGDLRGVGAVDDESGDVVTATDTFEGLPAAGVDLAPPPHAGAVYVVLQFPPSRMTTVDVFRPPQA